MDSKKRIILAISTALVLLLAMFIIIKIPFGSKAALQPKTNETPAAVSKTTDSSSMAASNSGTSQIKVVISKADPTSSRASGTNSQATDSKTVSNTTVAGTSNGSQTSNGSTTTPSTSTKTTTQAASGNFSTSNLVGMDCLNAMRQAEAAGYTFSILNLLNRDGSQVSESETQAMISNGTLNASIIETSISGNNILVNAMLNE